MLGKIYNELAKLIARDIYDAAKQVPATLSLLKATSLTKSGSGLPEAVLKAFEDAFLLAMRFSLSDGFGKWRDGKSEVRFTFRLTSGLVTQIRKVNWARAAKDTAEGMKQLEALGGEAKFNARIDNVVPKMVARAIAACQGQFQDSGAGIGWRILTPVAAVAVARRGTSDFVSHDLFYIATGNESDGGFNDQVQKAQHDAA